MVANKRIVYNEKSAPDVFGVVYRPVEQFSNEARTPVVLRANAGDCLVIKLVNGRQRRSSISLGQLVFDPQRAYGAAIGYDYDSTIAPGGGKRYEYYVDRELGVALALNLGDIDSARRGAFAAVVVEPPGSQYFRPGLDEPLPQGGLGVQADIVTEGVRTREFVALFSDEDRRIGQSAMPYPADVERFAGINYSDEPLSLRGLKSAPGNVFKSALWGDPRHVVQVPAGQPLTFRVAAPWGEQVHVPTLEGHRYPQEPGFVGSEELFNDVLAPGMSLDLHFVGGAGGDIHATGDYLFLDRRQPFLEFGLWTLLRVTDGDGARPDPVNISYANVVPQGNGSKVVQVKGRNGIRPAGDFAPSVTVYDGALVNGSCQGVMLGTAKVNAGSGDWRFAESLASVPAQLCIQSPGGGAAVVPLEAG